jgi:uncharacterized damage-inducible protein DinB
METNPVAANFLAFSVTNMKAQRSKIASCCDKLSETQLHHRAGDYENSILNLLLHLEGNIRQWILHGIDNQPDIRQRDDEFTLTLAIPSTEARTRLDATIEEAVQIIATLDPNRLLTITDPQPTGIARYPTILEAIYKVVGHLEMHTGQIILLTKQLLATDLDLSMPRKR